MVLVAFSVNRNWIKKVKWENIGESEKSRSRNGERNQTEKVEMKIEWESRVNKWNEKVEWESRMNKWMIIRVRKWSNKVEQVEWERGEKLKESGFRNKAKMVRGNRKKVVSGWTFLSLMDSMWSFIFMGSLFQWNGHFNHRWCLKKQIGMRLGVQLCFCQFDVPNVA